MAAKPQEAQQGNYNVDYVIRYTFAEGGVRRFHVSAETD